MEIRDASDALAKALRETRPDEAEDIESLHHARISRDDIPTILEDPRSVLEAVGVKVSDDSQINVTVKSQAVRAAARVRRRRIIVIIIHYRNCDADIIIFF
jgi:myo-inositol catabolism protein IolC